MTKELELPEEHKFFPYHGFDPFVLSGINFTVLPGLKKKFLLHPETLFKYLETLPKDEKGWIAFDFFFVRIGKTQQFARVNPCRTRDGKKVQRKLEDTDKWDMK